MVLPLQGIRVLDLSRFAPQSFATMILGDMGAEVIKIEAPPETGATRIGKGSMSSVSKETVREGVYDALNRNKKSIGINLTIEEGRQVFYKLVQGADVIMEGFRPGVATRLGIDYETVEELNPRIIYCALSGYGQTGPYRLLPGHDINYIAVAGALGLMAKVHGQPAVPLNLIADYAGGGLHSVIAILIALLARQKTRKGQHIDMSMLDGVMSLLTAVFSDYFYAGGIAPSGEVLSNGAYPYYCTYNTKDGKLITIGCMDPRFWENLCREVGREDFIPYHFQPEHLREKPKGEKWQEIFSFLRGVFATRTRDEWFEELRQKEIPVGRVCTLEEVLSDPQVMAREMVIELDHLVEGKIKQIGTPFKLSETPGKVRSLAPMFGQHTTELLLHLGYSEQDIEKLRQEGAVK